MLTRPHSIPPAAAAAAKLKKSGLYDHNKRTEMMIAIFLVHR
jgi:hypothetical protein